MKDEAESQGAQRVCLIGRGTCFCTYVWVWVWFVSQELKALQIDEATSPVEKTGAVASSPLDILSDHGKCLAIASLGALGILSSLVWGR